MPFDDLVLRPGNPVPEMTPIDQATGEHWDEHGQHGLSLSQLLWQGNALALRHHDTRPEETH